MIRSFVKRLRKALFPIHVKGDNNRYKCQSKIGPKFNIDVLGNNNSIEIGHNCLLTNTSIQVSGDNSKIVIEDEVRFMGPCQIIVGSGSTLIIRKNAGVRGVEFNLNGALIEVGELCMFSYGITLRNHDSHKIINPIDGSMLNPPKDIILGKHVWIAQNATVLKGCQIGDNSVIGFGAIVTKGCSAGSIMTGCPAKVVKENINWDY